MTAKKQFPKNYNGPRSAVSFLPFETRVALFFDLKDGLSLEEAGKKYAIPVSRVFGYRKTKEFKVFEEQLFKILYEERKSRRAGNNPTEPEGKR